MQVTTNLYQPRPPKRRVEEDAEQGRRTEPFEIFSVPIATHYRISVDETFETVKQFEELVQVLDQARAGDVIEIKLSTDGGALHAVLPTLNAMARTDATVFVHAVSDVASAGTFLLMMADDVLINPYVTVMFHQVSFGAFGPGNHVNDRVSHVVESSTNLLRDMYHDFFSEEEITMMLNGKEFWLTKEEFDARYAKRKELKEAYLMEAQRRLEEAQKVVPAKKPRKRKAATEQAPK